MNICDLKFCRCTMAEYKNLDKYDANMLYFVSDGDKIIIQYMNVNDAFILFNL